MPENKPQIIAQRSFNTGRMYSSQGQPIDWEQRDGCVYFYDRARGINGTFGYAEKHGKLEANRAQAMIMAHYDNGLYDNA